VLGLSTRQKGQVGNQNRCLSGCLSRGCGALIGIVIHVPAGPDVLSRRSGSFLTMTRSRCTHHPGVCSQPKPREKSVSTACQPPPPTKFDA